MVLWEKRPIRGRVKNSMAGVNAEVISMEKDISMIVVVIGKCKSNRPAIKVV